MVVFIVKDPTGDGRYQSNLTPLTFRMKAIKMWTTWKILSRTDNHMYMSLHTEKHTSINYNCRFPHKDIINAKNISQNMFLLKQKHKELFASL